MSEEAKPLISVETIAVRMGQIIGDKLQALNEASGTNVQFVLVLQHDGSGHVVAGERADTLLILRDALQHVLDETQAGRVVQVEQQPRMQ
jgi:hypothetical protein